jgi:MscS family membrane protein
MFALIESKHIFFAVLSLVFTYFMAKVIKSKLEDVAQKINSREVLTSLLYSIAKALPMLSFVLVTVFILRMLPFGDSAQDFINTTTEILLILAIGFTLFQLIGVPCQWWKTNSESTESKIDDMLVPLVEGTAKIFLIVLILVQMAQVISNKPLTSIIAGLGIGGLAIALASQEMIKNFFGSLMIMADRPFEIGDRIVVDGFDGPVTKVGMRSTTIETLEGHKVTIPNARLADKTIQNIGVRPSIRRIENLMLPPDTSSEKMQQALEIARRLLENHEGMNEEFPPRVYFNDFAEGNFNIIIIYWYFPPAYWDFLAHAERLNLALVKEFGEAGITFSFNTSRMMVYNREGGLPGMEG